MVNAPALYGFDPDVNGYWVPPISNMHDHLRGPDDVRFPIAVKEAATRFHYNVAMPNLGKEQLIRTPEMALAYQAAIIKEARKYSDDFYPIVPLYIEPDLTPETVERGFRMSAWMCAKLYSKGATTQSAEGVDFRYLKELYPAFAKMQELGMVLLIHLEPVVHQHNGLEINPFRREHEGIKYLRQLAYAFPKLKIVLEHVSSYAGVQAVTDLQREGFPIEATVAPQYLVWYCGDLFRNGMNPAKFSIPVLKNEEDRAALVDFVINGGGFLGTDSAPHTIESKAKATECPGGVFNNPVAVSVYFDLFKTEGEKRGITDWLERFVAFACHKGPRFYGFPEPEGNVLIACEPWKVPAQYGEGRNGIIPMLAGEEVPYKLIGVGE